jgi:hypothetical protein
MTDRPRRRRSKAPASRMAVTGASVVGFAGLLAAFPLMADEPSNAVALDVSLETTPTTLPAPVAAAPPKRTVVRVIVRRHIVKEDAQPAAGGGTVRAVPRYPAVGNDSSAPPPAANPAPAPPPAPRPAPAPQPDANTHGSR